MKKICCVFNTPSLYRELIYSRIEKLYDCDWYFEECANYLKEFDTSKFHHVTRLKTYSLGPFYGVKGMLALLRDKRYTDYLMMGHSRNITTLLFVIFKKLFYPSKKVYLWTHGLYGKENLIERIWKKILYEASDHLFIYSDYSCKVVQKAGVDSNKLHAIHNSLNYDAHLKIRQTITKSDIYRHHFKNDNPTLIFIGRLNPIKRLDMLINAISKLKEQGEIYNLVYIGDGPEANRLQSEAKTLNVENQVWFYGACYDEGTNAELIYNADLCISPGNIGLTAIHALTFGCPALTHCDFSHQMPEFEAIKEGVTGTFFKYNNQDSLVKAISSWFKQENYNREKIRQNCYAEIDKNWNPNYQVKILYQVIK